MRQIEHYAMKINFTTVSWKFFFLMYECGLVQPIPVPSHYAGRVKQSSDRQLTMETCFLLFLASAKRVGELKSLSDKVKLIWGWTSFNFFVPSFVAKTQNLLYRR